jgi:hypothetical protein
MVVFPKLLPSFLPQVPRAYSKSGAVSRLTRKVTIHRYG